MLDLSARKVYGALAEQCVGGDAKADKVENATSGHLAGLDSNGNLTDSGVSPTEEVTVEGNPVTFDSPFEQDAKSVVVTVKPIQDLHGLPFPYVGGAYKNKLPLVLADIKSLNTTGTWSGNVYTIGNRTFEVLVDSADNITGIKVNGSDSSTHSFDVNTPVNLGINAILNGCPAGGAEDTYEILTMGTSSTYRDRGTGASFEWDTDVMARIVIRGGYSASNLVFRPMARLSSVADSAFAPYSNICPISGIDEVEIGVSDGESEPTTTTIPLPSTLYDADVDVTNGDADSRFGYSKVTGVNSGSNRLNGDFYGNINGLTNVKSVPNNQTAGNALCNIARNVSAEERFNATDCCIAVRTNGQIDICIPGITSQEDLNTYLAEHDVYVCYELATPTTLSFDPADVELLEGTNVVSTNGEKVAVTYGRSLWQDIDELKTDTEGKLDKSDVADVEGDTASRPYSVNEFMLRADGFYKVTQPIANGASITASNTTKTTVGEVLTALLNA